MEETGITQQIIGLIRNKQTMHVKLIQVGQNNS
jgi:hypothetical protein